MKGGEFLIKGADPGEVFTPEDLTEEQRMFTKSAEEFMEKEVLPNTENEEEVEKTKTELMPKLMRKVGELGFLGLGVPEKYGGGGVEFAAMLAAEDAFAKDSGFSISVGAHTGIGTFPILLFGSPEQKKKYLPKLASGEMLAAFAETEADSGSDIFAAKTTAKLSPDKKYYIVNGEKQFITDGGFADLFTISCKIDGDKDLSLLLVEKAFEGVSIGKEEDKMGIRTSSTCSPSFSDVKVPVENLLGVRGKGAHVILNVLNVGRAALGVGLPGSGKIILKEAVAYAKERRQFNKAICEFGAIKHKIAEMAALILAAESAGYRATGLLNENIMKILKEEIPEDEKKFDTVIALMREYCVECAAVKVFSAEMIEKVAWEGMQILGGYGYSKDYPMERCYRDARINTIFEGTHEINKLVVIQMLFRAGLKREIALMPAMEAISKEMLQPIPPLGKESPLPTEEQMIRMAKKLTLLACGLAARKYADKLGEMEEIVLMMSEMVIKTYVMESLLLRTLKRIQREGMEKSSLLVDATRIFLNDTFPEVTKLCRQICAEVETGDMLRSVLSGVRKFSRFEPINSVEPTRKIADYIIEKGGL